MPKLLTLPRPSTTHHSPVPGPTAELRLRPAYLPALLRHHATGPGEGSASTPSPLAQPGRLGALRTPLEACCLRPARPPPLVPTPACGLMWLLLLSLH